MKRKLYWLMLLLCMATGVSASSRDEVRTVLPFDSNWRFARYGMQPDGSYLREPQPAPSAEDFDDASWRLLDVPHDWAIEGPFRKDLDGFTGKLPWQGIGWYRKYFTLDRKDEGRRVYLDFDGAMAHAEVWLNGHKAGGWPYGYTSFRVDLTPYVRFGKPNVLSVRLNTEKWGSRWYPGAGIYRPVRMVLTRQVHVAQWGVFVTTPVVGNESATAAIRVEVENHQQQASDVSYSVAIYERKSDGRPGRLKARLADRRALRIAPRQSAHDSVTLEVKRPELWDLDNRQLYVARVSVFSGDELVDQYDESFGFRTIAFTHDRGFLLNGKSVRINGVCMHHDLGALGAAFNMSALRRQLTILKEMGCNAIRTSHNPPAPQLLDLADEMGFLVMDEAFDTWHHSKKKYDYASLYEDWHERDLAALIRRDRNHPSVIMWSTGNEVQEQYHPETGEARHLTEVVHRYDPTRPATFGASAPNVSALNGTPLQVDVHGMNYPAGVYGGTDFYGKFLEKPEHQHLAGYASETSSTMSSRGEYFPKRFHVSSYDLTEPGWGGLPDQEFEALDRYPAICGEFVWTGFDYLGEPTPFNSDASVLLNHVGKMSESEMEKERRRLDSIATHRPPSRSSYFGIVDLAGFPKDRYYLYQSRWRPELPMVHILPHWNFPDRVGEKTPVFVYTSGDEAELFLNGRSLGKKKKGQYEYRLRWEDVVYEPGELKAVAYRNGQLWAETSVVTTGRPAALKMEADKKVLCRDGEELLFVKISVVDAEGRLVPEADNFIRCRLLGAGEIVATDNGDPTSHIIFSETGRPAFNGLFLAIVKASRDGKGNLTLKAEADGLPEAVLEIKTSR